MTILCISETAFVKEKQLTDVQDITEINRYDQNLKPKQKSHITDQVKTNCGEIYGKCNDSDQLFATEQRYGVKFSEMVRKYFLASVHKLARAHKHI